MKDWKISENLETVVDLDISFAEVTGVEIAHFTFKWNTQGVPELQMES